jgi:hypothetical protein
MILLIFFCLFATILLASIIQTIRTNPGIIPEDKEWDMMSEGLSQEESDQTEPKSRDEA